MYWGFDPRVIACKVKIRQISDYNIKISKSETRFVKINVTGITIRQVLVQRATIGQPKMLDGIRGGHDKVPYGAWAKYPHDWASTGSSHHQTTTRIVPIRYYVPVLISR
jgi:hypothetical protein